MDCAWFKEVQGVTYHSTQWAPCISTRRMVARHNLSTESAVGIE